MSSCSPSTILLRLATVKISLPGSRSMVKPTKGYRREEAGISSTSSFSSSFRREVACLDLDLLAENRWMKLCSSRILSSVFLVLFPHQLLHQLAGFIPEIVVAHIELDLVVIDIHNMGADIVQKWRSWETTMTVPS